VPTIVLRSQIRIKPEKPKSKPNLQKPSKNKYGNMNHHRNEPNSSNNEDSGNEI